MFTMNDSLFKLMQNRNKLLAKIAAQREQLTEIEADWRAPLALADRGVAIVRFLRCHPLLVSGVMAIILFRRHSMTGMTGLMWGDGGRGKDTAISLQFRQSRLCRAKFPEACCF